MKLIQFFLPGKGRRVGLIRGDQVLDVTAPEEGVSSTLDLVAQGKTAAGCVTRATWLAKRLRRKPLDYQALQRAPSRRAPHLVIPIDSPEAWGVMEALAPGITPGAAGAGRADRHPSRLVSHATGAGACRGAWSGRRRGRLHHL